MEQDDLAISGLYDEFYTAFLKGKNLEHFLIYICNASTMDTTDPISNMIVLVLSSPVCISLSNIGVRVFKTTSIATIPYYLLDRTQEQIVHRLCTFMKNSGECSVISDSSGGFTVKFPPSATPLFADKQDVMQSLQDAINGTVGYGDDEVKNRVFQIISQRISALTVLPQARKN